MFLARRTGFETRPMWQAIEAIRCAIDISVGLQQDRREYTQSVIQEVLNFLQINTYLDKGGECKRDLRRLSDRL